MQEHQHSLVVKDTQGSVEKETEGHVFVVHGHHAGAGGEEARETQGVGLVLQGVLLLEAGANFLFHDVQQRGNELACGVEGNHRHVIHLTLLVQHSGYQ